MASEHPVSDPANAPHVGADHFGQSVVSLRRRVLGRVVVAAHRGFSSAHPDNTVEAFEAAILAGADLIETDLRMSSDGVLFCHHDPDIDGRNIADTSSADLEGLGIIRLSAALSCARGRVGVLLDMKVESEDFATAVLKQVRDAGVESQTVLGVRSIAQARFLRRHSKTVVLLGFLRDYETFPLFYENGGDIARLWEEHLTPKLLAAAHDDGHPVWVTTRLGRGLEAAGAIDRARLKALFRLGVDGVLVNDPAAALTLRAQSYSVECR